MANKKSVLQEAEELIHGARQQAYSHPYIDFSRTAKMLTGLLSKKLKDGAEIDPEEVALIQVCVKLSRLIATPGHHDSMVDVPGYMGTYEMVMDWKDTLVSKDLNSDDIVRLCDNEELEAGKDTICIEAEDSTLLSSKIARILERERYHQNLRAMNINSLPYNGLETVEESDDDPI